MPLTLHFADSRSMPELADRSVHLVVTSPPYWQLKDYGATGQIGMDQDYAAYLADLEAAWRECDRVLHPGDDRATVRGVRPRPHEAPSSGATPRWK